MSIRNATLIWIGLLLLTLLSFSLGEVPHPGPLALLVIGMVTLVKGKLVIDYFMGLKPVGGLFLYMITGWLVLVLSLIAIAFRFA